MFRITSMGAEGKMRGTDTKMILRLLVVLLPTTLIGCGPGGLSNADAGTGIGAVAGGLLGSQVGSGSGRVAATMVGAFIGGIVGHEIGKRMDAVDRQLASRAEYQALENGRSGRPVPWRNPESGHYGEIVPESPYKLGNRHCRRYTHTIYIDGRPQTLRGRACRNPDGTWHRVS